MAAVYDRRLQLSSGVEEDHRSSTAVRLGDLVEMILRADEERSVRGGRGGQRPFPKRIRG